MELVVLIIEDSYDEASASWEASLRCEAITTSVQVVIREPFDTAHESELKWYLEQYVLVNPFAHKRSNAVLKQIERYKNELAADLQEAIESILRHFPAPSRSTLRILIQASSPDSRFQRLHWELIEDAFAFPVEISRSVVGGDAHTLINQSSLTEFNILFLSARPNYRKDINYRLISRKVLDILDLFGGKCRLVFVRPGTWRSFQTELGKYPKGYFQLAHLDVHGEIRKGVSGLIFAPVTYGATGDFQSASDIAQELIRAGIQSVVLNACNSAKSGDSHSNLAQTFTNMGMAHVLAMSFAIMAHTAEEFIVQLYRNLFVNSMDLHQAVSMSRQFLRKNPLRHAQYGLQREVYDAFVPVLYQSAGKPTFKISISREEASAESISMEKSQVDVPYFVGRDSDILELEECLDQNNIVNLVGSAGSGKSYFARYLSWWWQSTKFFDACFLLSARAPRILENGCTLQVIASLLSGADETRNLSAATKESPEKLILDRRVLILLDDAEIGDYSASVFSEALPDRPFSFLQGPNIESIRKLTLEFNAAECQSKLLIFTRTNRLYLELAKQSLLQGYILQELSSRELTAITMRGRNMARHAMDAEEMVQLTELLEAGENNPGFTTTIVIPCLNAGMQPSDISTVTELDLPIAAAECIESIIAAPDKGPSILHDFRQIVQFLKSKLRKCYDILLTLAFFRQNILASMRPLLINSVARKLISGELAPLSFTVSRKQGYQAASQPEAQQKFLASHPEILRSYKVVLELLLLTGLVTAEGQQSPICTYIKLHPMLPFLIRQEIFHTEDSTARLFDLKLNYLEYFEFRTNQFPHLSGDHVRWILAHEWVNIQNAAKVCLKLSQFGQTVWFTINALHYSSMRTLTSRSMNEGLRMLQSVLTEYERWERMSSPPALPSPLLTQALRIVGQIINVANTLMNVDLALASAKRGLSLIKNYGRVFGAIGTIDRCLEFQFQATSFLYGDAKSYKNFRFLQSLLEAEVPENTPESFRFFFDGQKASLVQNVIAFELTSDMLKQANIGTGELLKQLNDLLETLKKYPEAKNDVHVQWLEKFTKMAVALGDPNTRATDYVQFIPQLRLMARNVPALNPTVTAVSQRVALDDLDDGSARRAYLTGLAAAHHNQDVEGQMVFHDMLFHLAADGWDINEAMEHHEQIVGLERQLDLLGNQGYGEEIRHLREAERYLALGSYDIMTMVNGNERNEEFVRRSRERIERGLELGQKSNNPETVCKALHILARWEVNFGAGAAVSMGHTTKAVLMGPKANTAAEVDMEDGKFLKYLVRLWRLYEKNPAERQDLIRAVADELKWDASFVSELVETCSDKLEGYAEQNAVPEDFMVEAQKIIFGKDLRREDAKFWVVSELGKFNLKS